ITIDPAGAGQTTITSNGTTYGPFATGAVAVFGLGGDDQIIANPALTIPVALYGGPGNSTLVGGQGNDTLVAGVGKESLVGGPGDDLLENAHGNDTLVGGLGNNTYRVIPGSNVLLVEESQPNGIATIDFSQAHSGLVLDLSLNAGQPQLVDGRDTVALINTF